MRFARVENGAVQEVVDLAEGESPDDFYHPAIAATFVEDPASVAQVGDEYDGANFAAPAGPTLEEVKADAIAKVDAEAEAARLQYITGGAAMALVYERKRAEAEAFLADGAPDPADYPLLKARAERLDSQSPNYAAVAAEWNAKATAWEAIAATIEGLREGAKEDIAAAADAAAVVAASTITWPTPA